MRTAFFQTKILLGLLPGIFFALALWAEGSDGVDARLRQARTDWILARGAAERVEKDYRRMAADAEADPQTLLAMEQYLSELKEVAETRKRSLEDLEKMAGRSAPATEEHDPSEVDAFDQAVAQVPETAPAETEQERLDREFRESLENFDGMILAHNEKLEARMDAALAQTEKVLTRQQSAVEEAEALLNSMGVETGEGGETGETNGNRDGQESMAAASSGEAENRGEGRDQPAAGETAAHPTEPPHGTRVDPAAGGGTSGGAQRAPREDEDIVARQLREAAEKEKDPVLREKLWKEYEAYLDGRS